MVLVRDTDGSKDRQKDLEHGIESAAATFPGVRMAGGSAHPRLENWLFALTGRHKSEDAGKNAVIEALNTQEPGAGDKVTEACVRLVKTHSSRLSDPPEDAHSLRLWVSRVCQCFGPRV